MQLQSTQEGELTKEEISNILTTENIVNTPSVQTESTQPSTKPKTPHRPRLRKQTSIINDVNPMKRNLLELKQ